MYCSCESCTERTARKRAVKEGWDTVEGQWYCPDCIDYAAGADGEVVCSSHGYPGSSDSGHCPDCGEEPDWGPMQTGSGGADYAMYGTCGCARREWSMKERGGTWTVPVYSD